MNPFLIVVEHVIVALPPAQQARLPLLIGWMHAGAFLI
jgi:hypothetical protein